MLLWRQSRLPFEKNRYDLSDEIQSNEQTEEVGANPDYEPEILDPGPSGTFEVVDSAKPPLAGLPLLQAIADAAWERKAYDLEALRVNDLVGYTDYFIVCSARSDRQVNAISSSIERSLRKLHRTKANGVEGRDSGNWVCMDYVDVVVHILYQPVREYYELEKLWSDAERVALVEPDWLQHEAANKWDWE